MALVSTLELGGTGSKFRQRGSRVTGRCISQHGRIELCEASVMDTCPIASLVVFCCVQSRTRQNCVRE